MRFNTLTVLAVASMASAFVLPTSRSSIKLMNPVKRADKLYMADENEKSLIETTEKGVASFFAPALPFALSALYRKNLAEREEKLIEEELAVLKAKQKLKEEQFKEDILKSIGAGTLGVLVFIYMNLVPTESMPTSDLESSSSLATKETVVPPPSGGSTSRSSFSDPSPVSPSEGGDSGSSSFKDLLAKLEVGKEESSAKVEDTPKVSESTKPEAKVEEVKPSESLTLEDIKAAAASAELKMSEAVKESVAPVPVPVPLPLPELKEDNNNQLPKEQSKAAVKEDVKSDLKEKKEEAKSAEIDKKDEAKKEEKKVVEAEKKEEPKKEEKKAAVAEKKDTLKPSFSVAPSMLTKTPESFMDKIKAASEQKTATEKKDVAPIQKKDGAPTAVPSTAKYLEVMKPVTPKTISDALPPAKVPKEIRPVIAGAAVLSVGVLGALIYVAQSDPTGDKKTPKKVVPGPPRKSTGPQATSTDLPKGYKPKPKPSQSGTGTSYLENMIGSPPATPSRRPVKPKPVATTTQVDNGAVPASSKPKDAKPKKKEEAAPVVTKEPPIKANDDEMKPPIKANDDEMKPPEEPFKPVEEAKEQVLVSAKAPEETLLQPTPPPSPPMKKSYFPGSSATGTPKKPPMGGGSYLDRLS